VVKGGITAEFRGTTDDGVAITAKCVGGRALSLDSAGNATIYFTLRGLVAHPEIALDAECRLLITNFAISAGCPGLNINFNNASAGTALRRAVLSAHRA
jgi:hypothetical protein